MANIQLSSEQEVFVESTYKNHSRQATFDLFDQRWPDIYTLSKLVSLIKRRKWTTTESGHYKPGNRPWSAGKKIGTSGRTAQTQFKRGNVPLNTKHLGHERLHKGGYVLIQVAEENPQTGYKHRYRLKHRVLWEQQHGPIPQGKLLRSRDGDKANCDPDNWVLLSRAENAWLTAKGYADVPEDYRDLMIATAKLDLKIKGIST